MTLAGHDHRRTGGAGRGGRYRDARNGCSGSGGNWGNGCRWSRQRFRCRRSTTTWIELSVAFARLADHANVLQAGHVIALGGEDRQQRAGVFGGFVKSGLVGFIGEQKIAGSDTVADLLVPFADQAAFH